MNARRAATLVVCLLAGIGAAQAQPRVNERNMYERVLAIVPMIGAGTAADPKRPMYAPTPSVLATTAHATTGAPGTTTPPTRTGILGFTYELSDDGKFALVEFVARDRTAFQTILSDAAAPGATVQAFVKGVHQKADVEAAFKALKKNFDFDHFGVRMP